MLAVIKALTGAPYRQLEGVCIEILGEKDAPDHSTIHTRINSLDVSFQGTRLALIKTKGGKLTPREKQRNKKISSKRITVEHSICRIKQWGIMKGPYDGTPEEFHDELVMAAGLANFLMLWDKKRKRPRLDY